ncbi:SCO7613 C-terminal domain-containing membrane protein [Nocardioides sp. cx-173]|uniref:SCO7613 C-terminal domain-containing membrane protein n=1 Tax=Nocardioides sp. cx-173 TaxID=2898796 RepID=UPI001E499DA1|nr:hypothetical protein [Nocardioides sp. cx-173]MCD4525405.1 hypothetical protein [Nocardioides sp. cx-173]UGB40800.1 hypothetical protein LQ940_15635 [Nocardioides sp. cx-173]
MTRYGDPSACPDCRASLPTGAERCPSCDLPLTHPVAAELLATLTYADHLLARLRAVGAVPVAASFVPPVAPMPRAAAPARRTGVRAASVPKILLGLGAFCLLVAAVIFLAVAWSWLGVGGRTAVLVTLTAAAGAAGAWFAHRGLRVAGEALTAVSLGLLVLDVVGADNAGWLGERPASGLALVVGATVAVVSLGLALLPTRLVAPQLATVAGAGVAAMAAFDLTDGSLWLAAAAVLVFAGLAGLGQRTTLAPLMWAAAAGASVSWIVLTSSALSATATDTGVITFTSVWAGPGWALLAASAFVLLPLVVHRARETVVVAVASAASMLSLTLAVPFVDDGVTTVAVVALGLLVTWTGLSLALPRAWSVVARVPATLAAVPVAVVAAALAAEAALRTLEAGQSEGADVLLGDAAPWAHPAVLLPSVAALLVLVAAWIPRTRGTAGLVTAAAALAAASVATLALCPVPLWTVVAALALAGAVLVADSLRRETGAPETLVGLGGLAVSLVAGRGSEVLVTVDLGLLTAAAVALLALGWAPASRPLGDLLLPGVLAALIWSGAGLGGIEVLDRAVPILVVVGLLAIARPHVELEASAAVAAAAAAGASVLAAHDTATAASLHLTVAGVLVTASSLVHERRRALAVPGGALLLLATWVRLADLGVEAPEAYTLPLAAVLVLVGLRRVRRDPAASTGASLTPGLVLATVPSLLWVLAGDPVSPRAVLLGAGCLTLVLAGTRLRWSAPLVVGATVGAVLAARELAPYVAETPQWVVLGVAGVLLTVVGVTWERRLVELRQASAYLERLR